MATYHLAQLNIARMRAPLDDPLMRDFTAALPEINALADASAGFVWRLTDDDGVDATALRPFAQDLLVNMSVWTSLTALRDYIYRTAHLEFLRRRREWFRADGPAPHAVLWWLPAGRLPTLDEARERLDRLATIGPGPAAFSLRHPFPAPDRDAAAVGATGVGGRATGR
ncbi:MAG TPA: DUF3291 domain-containing protein [Pilimelia sp.]|nr:DUF3291 domain-containing protein [Pilimelia sp.]